MPKVIYWTFFSDGDVRFILAVTKDGLCFTGSLNKKVDELEQWVKKRFPKAELVESAEQLKPYAEAFLRYMRGESQAIACALDVKGTEFQQQVWQALQTICYGEVVSYKEIAKKIGRPTAVRAVGGAIGANPVMIVVPCHRVIGKDGKLTGFRGGLPMKERLLALEKKYATQ